MQMAAKLSILITLVDGIPNSELYRDQWLISVRFFAHTNQAQLDQSARERR